MRKKRYRFTNVMLKRFKKEERGLGINKDYSPWHQIKRSEPSSRGKSSRIILMDRLVHTLSTVELNCVLFATMIYDVIDIREQFPLNKYSEGHELNEYTDSYGIFYPGTTNIADQLGFKHPQLRDGSKELWTITTDILMTIKLDAGLNLLAISCKKVVSQSKRQKELLEIEKHYWNERGVEWLLITPDLYGRGFADQLRASRKVALSVEINQTLQRAIVEEVATKQYSYIGLSKHFTCLGYTMENIQKAFWNAFWFGDIPLKIASKFDESRPIRLQSKADFHLENPIYSGRSAWIS